MQLERRVGYTSIVFEDKWMIIHWAGLGTCIGAIVMHCHQTSITLYAHWIIVVTNGIWCSCIAHRIVQKLLQGWGPFGRRRRRLLLVLYFGRIVARSSRLDVVVPKLEES
ncbi:hypothetical protein BDB00DRAFT_824762 [Zychaea mexicana]|uniref:uncharacterized protein n=1 Tax=Zychaea mexicana TaxID=64656 RepID=UPI0022FDC471|nr:uncharacterized protein BDB00DRAFT_824762 [Zychaea mexicana]KAI9493192.1 hypothetical protein BDB00DRAFT_824762 [Zychaea mexicana]